MVTATAMMGLIVMTGIAHLLSAFRLACYHRNEEQYSWRGGLINSLFGSLFCLAGMDVLLKGVPVSPWHTAVSVLACTLIFRCGGNLRVLWYVLRQ
ncbi:phage holin family protein [Pseudomonas sp. PB3P13]